MLIRFPWRRRQIGFLVTHGGILVLLAGCAATRWVGVEAQLSVYEGHANHVAVIDGQQDDAEEKKPSNWSWASKSICTNSDGGSIPAAECRRTIRAGSIFSTAAIRRKAKKLQEDVLITLNAPVDFTDPRTGRTYRLFQSSFEGPWLPGDAEFDELVGNDRSRDRCISRG